MPYGMHTAKCEGQACRGFSASAFALCAPPLCFQGFCLDPHIEKYDLCNATKHTLCLLEVGRLHSFCLGGGWTRHPIFQGEMSSGVCNPGLKLGVLRSSSLLLWLGFCMILKMLSVVTIPSSFHDHALRFHVLRVLPRCVIVSA
ncbi:hypothetical protein CsSME_00044173 [Camellia sinensis var. sinensis]